MPSVESLWNHAPLAIINLSPMHITFKPQCIAQNTDEHFSNTVNFEQSKTKNVFPASDN